jgi:S1-C subfamily serine protease
MAAPHEALPPLFVTAVLPRSPAASHGPRPGDIIVSVNGAPPFTDGILSEGVMNLLLVPTRPRAGYRCNCTGPSLAAPGR